MNGWGAKRHATASWSAAVLCRFATERARLGTVRPRIIAFCPGALPQRLDLRVLFEAGLLHAAVISRRAGARASAAPKGMQGWFDRHYQLVTAANVGRLYEPVEGSP